MRFKYNIFRQHNVKNKEHKNVYFCSDTTCNYINESKNDYIKIDKKVLKKKKKLEKIIKEKLDNLEENSKKLNKKESNFDKTEVLDLSDIKNTSIIPTVAYKDYINEKKKISDSKTTTNNKFFNLLKKIFNKQKLLNVDNVKKSKNKEEKKLLKQKKKEQEKLLRLEEKKNKEQTRLKKEMEQQKLKEQEEKKKREKQELKEEQEQKRKAKQESKSTFDLLNNDRKLEQELERKKREEEKQILKQKQIEKKEQEKLLRLEEKKKKEQERLEKIRKDVEEEAIRKKERDEKKLALLLEKEEKKKQLEKEKEQAKIERREKAKLIKKAQEESKQKEKKERKTIDEKLKDWYNNLSFVKDRQNRREMQRQTLLIDFEGSDAVRSEEKIMYKYVAKNNETGKVETGYFSAYSKLDVHSFLIAENYEVYEITPQKSIVKNIDMFSAKFKSTELDFFLTQLSTFLKSGITLIDSMKILSKQCKKKSQKRVYKALIYELTMGENFSESLAKQGTIFPRLLINMIKTSELTGDLPETLDDMADYYREIEKTKKQMISAITYPAVILVFAFSILIFIMVSVIPQFVSIYSDLDTELPTITVIVINLSNFLQKNWGYVIIALVGFILVFALLLRTIKVFRTVVQSALMNMPVFGKIMIYNEVTMFTKTFASLLNHNVYITDCMEVLSKITNNEIYKMLIFDTITNLAKGEAISNSFKNHWAFPTIAYEMILTGEKTGQLGNMMNKVASYYQEQHKNAVNQIKAFIEPVLIVVLAAIVGVVLLSVVLPMFGMYENLQ